MKPSEYVKKNKIVQKDMATDLGITEGYLSSIIQGKRTPSTDLAKKFEKYCNYEVSRLELLYPDEDWSNLQIVQAPKKAPTEIKRTTTAILPTSARDQVLDIIRGIPK